MTVQLLPLGKPVFEQCCASLCVKPIVLDLETDVNQVVQQDVMTSSKYFSDDKGAFSEMNRIVVGLETAGFQILRKKIESEPGHVRAPQEVGQVMPEHCYFESHVAFLIQESQREILKEIATCNHAHISRNPFKKTDDGMVVMVTLRDYQSPFCLFKKQVDALLSDAATSGFVPHKKIEVEFAVYDSNTMHDASWINN